MESELIFCKSKVFIHPSKSAADNVPGFLIICKEAGQSKQDSTLAWVPERVLRSDQLQWFNDAELDLDKVKRKAPTILSSTRASWQFSVKLNSLYSIEFRLPNPNGWWYGSVLLHSRSFYEDDTLPALFFHDDICPSTELRRKELNKSFDPFASSGDVYWGGVDFRNTVRELVDLQRTVVDSTVWLINASLDDLRNFSPQKLTKDQDSSKNNYSDDLNGAVWNTWESAKWGVMSRIADATSKTGSYMGQLIRRHPLVKIAERNSDSPYVKKLLANPRVQEVQDDFDSARVYLAKWALGVKQEAENYQRNHRETEVYRRLLTNELGIDGENDVKFTDEELNRALERNYPLTRQKWDSFFDAQGRLMLTVQEIKDHIFHGGIKDMELRKEVWMFLFGVYFWDSSADERLQLDQTLREVYEMGYKEKWVNREPHEDQKEEEYWHDQIFRIDKDVKRNDRHMDIYEYNTADGKKPDSTTLQSGNLENIDEGSNNWVLKNPHLIALKNILVSYNYYNSDLGYVQGMCDLLSPIYYVVRDEALAFWCFVNFMERMERNFLRDQSGIRDQMYTLSELCQLMLPKLSEHLNKCDSSNLFFCFRMLLVWFKREFEFHDVCSVWECFLTDFYSSQFQLFFMLAILQKNADPIIQNLDQFDQVLKYFNDMHGTMDWDDLMTRAELLFVRFAKLMNITSRKEVLPSLRSDQGTSSSSGIQLHELSSGENTSGDYDEDLPTGSKYLRLLLSKQVVKQKEAPRQADSVK
ncbi:ZYRO0C10670p [Zygosaccharomyces rouxii]|uniref:ZYRO0C10670p n=1 Tax=Zygosaccharomyces rouxii (strain ATCC 2623 / CBS 732 / NBRC 1130 / NCYC 568 / NRRL Y-229) TaxID=559307 RepID=C5DTR5_ZYGRC|nr:uncharacterized protein ZYRO0C10670g [Zygosaccharomyces rouxii]KAH9201648.1 rab-GTPase-TBC domain-containing protein [Zygosaccharomyces rouxii]CAR27176.1 ZYRO0C10670p [Zygosaccharomyces rouxii]